MASYRQPNVTLRGSKPPSAAGPAARFTPGPASDVEGVGPKRFKDTGHKPRSRWSGIAFAIAVTAVAIAFLWIFLLPDEGGADPYTGEWSGTYASRDGTSWHLSSDLRTPIELQGVTEAGVAVRFLPDPAYAFVAVHVVACSVNGKAYDPADSSDAIHYTVLNESTGETVSTLDPYFITSGTGEGTSGTVVTIKVEGLEPDQYDSVRLGLDETLSKGHRSYGTSEFDEATDLSADVVREG